MNIHDRNVAGQAGLTTADARTLLATHGPNRLPEARSVGPGEIFLRQFLSPFIYILLVAALVSFAVGQTPSGIFIAAVLVLNATIGAVQEYSAARSAAALRQLVRGHARVIRDGTPRTIDIEEVVPGDLVILASGDRVPADLDLLATDGLTADESMLTGESVAVTKDATALAEDGAALGDQRHRCFAGSIITHGRGRGVVTATGTNTEIGQIATKVTKRRTSKPPLMIRITRFTYQVAAAILVAIVALIVLMLWRGGYEPYAIVMMAIGLAVSTIPEGLPAALTVALAIGMRRMAQENVIIRKLVAVEALGSCTFICSDKTGTLTVNEMTIHSALLPSGRSYRANGAGIAPGSVTGDELGRLEDLCTTGTLANESDLDYRSDRWSADGDIVDIAFLVFAKKLGLSLGTLRKAHRQKHLIPYESERAFSGSVNEGPAGTFLHVKGSPEKIAGASTLMQVDEEVVPIDRELIESQYEGLAAQGYRVLALARRPLADSEEPTAPDLDGLVFIGLVAMIDPMRPEARDAIARCRAGGIAVAMVTGDHPQTARAIGLDLGLCGPDDPVVTGPMLAAAERKGGDHVRSLVVGARVFARIDPVQKELIVSTLMDEGHFVAVTGDGVNDAPAMRKANAGVAMGKTGTDVAKEAADLIITDDNFASIVAGIEQGRIVYNNIRKVIALLTATGFSALFLFFATVLAGLPMPLTAVQLLWLNLVANGIQDVALAFEPKEGDELTEPPRNPREPIFERHVLEHILVIGSAMGLLAFLVYSTVSAAGVEHGQAQNITLLMMVLFGNVHALSSRSERKSIFSMPYFGNRVLAFAVPGALGIHVLTMYIPGLSDVIGIKPVEFGTFFCLVGVAMVLLALEELHKWTIRWRHDHDAEQREAPVADGSRR